MYSFVSSKLTMLDTLHKENEQQQQKNIWTTMQKLSDYFKHDFERNPWLQLFDESTVNCNSWFLF